MPDLLLLSGIVVVVVGFLLRLNPLLVVGGAAAGSGLAAGLSPVALLGAFGKAFNDNRFVTLVYIVLPVVGLLERFGLQERARAVILGLRGATTGRLLLGYLLFRQATAALGLISIAGHAQTVRPLVAPMAEAAAGDDPEEREHAKAMAAATDNVGVFFGEDVFVAIGSILLIKGVYDANGIVMQPLHLSLWAIPSAVLAFLIHGSRLLMMDAKRR